MIGTTESESSCVFVPAEADAAMSWCLAGQVLQLRGTADHPCDNSMRPSVTELLQQDSYLYIEDSPADENSKHVTLDVSEIIAQWPAQLRKRAMQAHAEQGHNAASDITAGPSSSNITVTRIDSNSTESDTTADSDSDEGMDANNTLQSTQTAGQASTSGIADNGHGFSGSSGNDETVDEPEEPPVITWWPEHEPERPDYTWAEMAVQMVESDSPVVTEMVQHLELCDLISMGCATYRSLPHLLQFFAPYAGVAGLQFPATVYLLDTTHHEGVQEVMGLIKPILESNQIVKVRCYSLIELCISGAAASEDTECTSEVTCFTSLPVSTA